MLSLGRQATKAVVYIWVGRYSVLHDNLSVFMTMILQLTATLFVDLCLTGSIIYGLLKSKTDGLNVSIKTIADQAARFETRLDSIEKRYRAQFVALDATLSSMQSTSDYLTQQLAALAANR